ncbi:hypothetical protein Lal_00032936 [Lupinus albus]|nr:hypothetical protein Lal_00032936 [Lupinus albus]
MVHNYVVDGIAKVKDGSMIFNKNVFGNIFRRKRRVKARICGVQLCLESYDDPDLVRFEATLWRERKRSKIHGLFMDDCKVSTLVLPHVGVEGMTAPVIMEEVTKYQSWKSRLSERFSPEQERIPWKGEILGYTGGFSSERELSRLGEKWKFGAVDTVKFSLEREGALSFSLDSPLAERTENHQALATGTSYNPHTSEHSEWQTKVCVFFFTMKPIGVFFGLD